MNLTPKHALFFMVTILSCFFLVKFFGLDYSTIEFKHAGKNYSLHYKVIADTLELESNGKIKGIFGLEFCVDLNSSDYILIAYDFLREKREVRIPPIPLKNTKGVTAKWYLEKREEEIKEIMTTAFFEVIKKEYPNILIDPTTKKLKLN